jgi:hypothetical protein
VRGRVLLDKCVYCIGTEVHASNSISGCIIAHIAILSCLAPSNRNRGIADTGSHAVDLVVRNREGQRLGD